MLGAKLVTRHGNYESKMNSIHIQLVDSRKAPNGLHTLTQTYTFHALAYVCTHANIHMVFVAFVMSCLPNSCKYVWIVQDGVEEAGKEG